MKYFVVSDVHSFYTPLIKALKETGFDRDNPDHILIVCGDLFDRGNETIEVYNFIKSIPKKRRILIRGNHEYLLKELLHKKYPEEYDYSNGTVRTCCAFTNINYEGFEMSRYDRFNEFMDYEKTWNKIRKSKRLENIVKWMFESDEWVNYYEVDKYIFVHSFIPLHNSGVGLAYTYKVDKVSYNPDWRENATPFEWWDATWGCPWQLFKEGLFKEKNKVLVVGHWHTSDFFTSLQNCDNMSKETLDSLRNICPIFKTNNLIAIDACTVHTHRTNVFTFITKSNKKS